LRVYARNNTLAESAVCGRVLPMISYKAHSLGAEHTSGYGGVQPNQIVSQRCHCCASFRVV